MRIGITGANGQLGQELQLHLRSSGHSVFAFPRQDLDICNEKGFKTNLSHLKLDFLINSAAYTDVDLAEKNLNIAFEVNAEGPLKLAKFCKSENIGLIHISTDSVFSSNNPQHFETKSSTNPINAYGRSKDAGEKAIITAYPEGSWIVRVSWIYGGFGGKFVHSIMSKVEDVSPLAVVNDQFGQPISTYAVSNYIDALILQRSIPGIYHFASRDFVSRFEFAQTILAYLGADARRVKPIPTISKPAMATRPRYSLLKIEDSTENLDIKVDTWKSYLTSFLQDIRR
jgi:dTDP-4-dehydrorhamnose reductase